ncbi:MAG TPA: cbb3-type cytochrome c oxidase subunit I [Planctomycetota bacterium]|jgi:cytochrome c oxidase subunit 1
MSTAGVAPASVPAGRDAGPTAPRNYLTAECTVGSWLLGTDHKRVAFLYLLAIAAFFTIGVIAAGLLRIHLLTPAGMLFSPETYTNFVTLHGVILVFFFLIPSMPCVLGNFLIPLMIGSKGLAFPRLNLASWYLFLLGGVCAIFAAVIGGADLGWTFYTPQVNVFSANQGVLTAIGVFLACFSWMLTGLNLIVTIHRLRAPGMTWSRLPLFVWTMYGASLLLVIGTPVAIFTLIRVAVARASQFGLFAPALGTGPLFFEHPAVYLMLLPCLGVICEVVACFARKRLVGYRALTAATGAIVALGLLVWACHLFNISEASGTGTLLSVLGFLLLIPLAVAVFNWIATLYHGSISFEAPMWYALGFICLLTIGALSGLYLSTPALDVHVEDTYFMIAQFHFVLAGGATMGYLAAIHFWWPKLTGHMYSQAWGRLAAALIFAGCILTFTPQFVLGYLGMSQYYSVYPANFQALNVLSTAGSLVLGAGYALPVFYLLASLKFGAAAGPNPWRAAGLEWTADSPPRPDNFTEIPVVTEEAYSYPRADTAATQITTL